MRQTSLLIAAHPGHELRVFQWLCQAKPQVVILTDGSGATGNSRIGSTAGVLRAAGAHDQSRLGLFSDRELYRNILERDFGCFFDIAATLARLLGNDEIESVVGDAAEGYNPGHDVCRLLINAAVDRAAPGRTLPLKNLEYAVVGPPEFPGRNDSTGVVTVTLDEATLQRKLQVALGYFELKHEVETAISQYGERAFSVERLRPVGADGQWGYWQVVSPYYERYGELQVQKGLYNNVIRYREHILPLKYALDEWVHGRRYGSPRRSRASRSAADRLAETALRSVARHVTQPSRFRGGNQ